MMAKLIGGRFIFHDGDKERSSVRTITIARKVRLR